MTSPQNMTLKLMTQAAVVGNSVSTFTRLHQLEHSRFLWCLIRFVYSAYVKFQFIFCNNKMVFVSLQQVCFHSRISSENRVFSEGGLFMQKYSQCSMCFTNFFKNCFGTLTILHYESDYFDWLWDTFQPPLRQLVLNWFWSISWE